MKDDFEVKKEELINNYENDNFFWQANMDPKTYAYIRVLLITFTIASMVLLGGIMTWFIISYVNGAKYLLFWIILLAMLIGLAVYILVYVVIKKDIYKNFEYKITTQGVMTTVGIFKIKKYIIPFEEIESIDVGKGILYSDLRAGNVYISVGTRCYVIANVLDPIGVRDMIIDCIEAYYTAIQEEAEFFGEEEAEGVEEIEGVEEAEGAVGDQDELDEPSKEEPTEKEPAIKTGAKEKSKIATKTKKD